jgi:hypothetical protein
VTFTRRAECRTPGRSKALEPGPPAARRVSSVRLAEQTPRSCRRRAGLPVRPGVPDGKRAVGCREALRLTATGEALKAHEAYGWMWLETTATRVCRDQAAERVRNPGSGRRWGGNPACQRSAHLIPSKGIEPREGVFGSCCERPAIRLRADPVVALWRRVCRSDHTMWS